MAGVKKPGGEPGLIPHPTAAPDAVNHLWWSGLPKRLAVRIETRTKAFVHVESVPSHCIDMGCKELRPRYEASADAFLAWMQRLRAALHGAEPQTPLETAGRVWPTAEILNRSFIPDNGAEILWWRCDRTHKRVRSCWGTLVFIGGVPYRVILPSSRTGLMPRQLRNVPVSKKRSSQLVSRNLNAEFSHRGAPSYQVTRSTPASGLPNAATVHGLL